RHRRPALLDGLDAAREIRAAVPLLRGGLTMTDFTRKWCPSMWLDEVMPAPQPSPDDFIHQLGLGAFQLRAPDEPDDEAFVVDILPGQVIEFSAFDDFGEIEVVVNDDLSFTQDRPTPVGATQFCILGDPESMDSS